MGMSTFKRGLVISPFQIPLLAYLIIEGILICLGADAAATAVDVPAWSFWNLGLLLTGGGALATFSRFNDNERLETFGLLLVFLGIGVALGISVATKDYDVGGELAVGLGCLLRIRVLSKARQAERVAIQISGEIDNNDAGEKT